MRNSNLHSLRSWSDGWRPISTNELIFPAGNYFKKRIIIGQECDNIKVCRCRIYRMWWMTENWGRAWSHVSANCSLRLEMAIHLFKGFAYIPFVGFVGQTLVQLPVLRNRDSWNHDRLTPCWSNKWFSATALPHRVLLETLVFQYSLTTLIPFHFNCQLNLHYIYLDSTWYLFAYRVSSATRSLIPWPVLLSSPVLMAHVTGQVPLRFIRTLECINWTWQTLSHTVKMSAQSFFGLAVLPV